MQMQLVSRTTFPFNVFGVSRRYALLVGRPPFETSTLKETYLRITENSYTLPNSLSNSAKNLIRKCLSPDPARRPTLDDLLADEYFTCGYMPRTLTPTACSTVPKFPVYTKFNRWGFTLTWVAYNSRFLVRHETSTQANSCYVE